MTEQHTPGPFPMPVVLVEVGESFVISHPDGDVRMNVLSVMGESQVMLQASSLYAGVELDYEKILRLTVQKVNTEERLRELVSEMLDGEAVDSDVVIGKDWEERARKVLGRSNGDDEKKGGK